MKHSAIRKRGRFRPLAGMVLRKVGTYDGDVGFRPLTGTVRICNSQVVGSNRFRPLTGMVHGKDAQ